MNEVIHIVFWDYSFVHELLTSGACVRQALLLQFAASTSRANKKAVPPYICHEASKRDGWQSCPLRCGSVIHAILRGMATTAPLHYTAPLTREEFVGRPRWKASCTKRDNLNYYHKKDWWPGKRASATWSLEWLGLWWQQISGTLNAHYTHSLHSFETTRTSLTDIAFIVGTTWGRAQVNKKNTTSVKWVYIVSKRAWQFAS